MRVALTGGIATGKSYCLARFETLGVPTVDADRLARLAVAPGSAGFHAVVARFGRSVERADGTLDRAALAAIVFADGAARADLEAIVHPEVYRRIRDWFVRLPPGTAIGMADIPLLFETGHAHDFDAVVVAACSAGEQLERLASRGMDTTAARARLAAQWPIDEKIRRADHVIDTGGSFAETDAQVRQIFDVLMQRAAAAP